MSLPSVSVGHRTHIARSLRPASSAPWAVSHRQRGCWALAPHALPLLWPGVHGPAPSLPLHQSELRPWGYTKAPREPGTTSFETTGGGPLCTGPRAGFNSGPCEAPGQAPKLSLVREATVRSLSDRRASGWRLRAPQAPTGEQEKREMANFECLRAHLGARRWRGYHQLDSRILPTSTIGASIDDALSSDVGRLPVG